MCQVLSQCHLGAFLNKHVHACEGERGTCRNRVSYTRLKEISRWSIVQPDKMRVGRRYIGTYKHHQKKKKKKKKFKVVDVQLKPTSLSDSVDSIYFIESYTISFV